MDGLGPITAVGPLRDIFESTSHDQSPISLGLRLLGLGRREAAKLSEDVLAGRILVLVPCLLPRICEGMIADLEGEAIRLVVRSTVNSDVLHNSAESFTQFRPGPVRQFMRTPPQVVAASAPLAAAVLMMREMESSYLMVVDDGRMVGILTSEQIPLRSHCAETPNGRRKVAEAMLTDFLSCRENQETAEVAELMETCHVSHLPVLDANGCPVCEIISPRALEEDVAFDQLLAD